MTMFFRDMHSASDDNPSATKRSSPCSELPFLTTRTPAHPSATDHTTHEHCEMNILRELKKKKEKKKRTLTRTHNTPHNVFDEGRYMET